MRIRFVLAHFRPLNGLKWSYYFWRVQWLTLVRPVCAELPTNTITSGPRGADGHIHWCDVYEGDNHNEHTCHGCSVVWYDKVAPGEKPHRVPGRRAGDVPDSYGFVVFP